MSITFGKTRADNFGRIFEDNPRSLTRNPYLNYLRHYKAQHPKYSLVQIMRHGSRSWRNLKPSQQQLFTQKNVLRSISRPRPTKRRRAGVARSIAVPGQRIPMSYKRRSLNASRNIRRSWSKTRHLPKYRTNNTIPLDVRGKHVWSLNVGEEMSHANFHPRPIVSEDVSDDFNHNVVRWSTL